MNVQHSPKSGLSMSGSGNSSSPDLYSLTREEENSFVNQRKRKQPDCESQVNEKIDSFREEMMAFFKNFANAQKEDTASIRQDLNEIKNEIKTLKTATENLSVKYDNIHKELTSIKTENSEIRQKIVSLEKDISLLKNHEVGPSHLTDVSSTDLHENIISEFQDRCERMKNVVLVGVPELNNKDASMRQQHDLNEVINTFTQIKTDCPKPLKTVRLGKYFPDKTHIVKYLLRNKQKLQAGRRVYADQTPSQNKHLQNLKAELTQREQSGESNLTIKYIKGVPRIVKTQPKNQ
ncbi:hypothetical protein ABMA28_015231 [Loxostege sticticalis]|uniref:Uncharacterized protein n=1 Tax=Loxostege sticticalis TaxID=481309 RepID=A0ABD0TER9_LOXSC